MAKRVVDCLEPVEVKAEQGEHVLAAWLDAQLMIDMLVEHRAVGEARQDVVERQMGNPPFALLDLMGHVVEAGREARQFVVPCDHDLGIAAVGQPSGRGVEPRQGFADPPRGAPAGQDDDCNPHQPEQADRPLHRTIGRHRLGARVNNKSAASPPLPIVGSRLATAIERSSGKVELEAVMVVQAGVDLPGRPMSGSANAPATRLHRPSCLTITPA